MKAARIVNVKEPLQIQQLETPAPRGGEVLVRIISSGVCHSDIHLWEGGYEGIEGQFLKTTDRGVRYPLTPGHEIAGIVEAMGEGVEAFSKGDRVVVFPWVGDGICPACREGEENLCDKPRSLGIYVDGGYAEYVLVPSYKYLIKIGDGLDIDMAATLSCSVLTAYTAVKNASLRPDDNVVIVGTGGLGLMAIQVVKSLTGARVIAMDIDDHKLQVAKENGADSVIDFVNASKTVETDMQILRRRANVVLVGLYGGELRLNLVSMPTGAHKLIGSYTGNLRDLAELVSLAERGIIKPIVSNKFRLEQATEALTMLREGKITGRGVLKP
jgi:propanol-preferring alcohol dehydrogenase